MGGGGLFLKGRRKRGKGVFGAAFGLTDNIKGSLKT